MALTLRDLAEQLNKALITKKRDNGTTYVALVDGSPEWMTQCVYQMHLGEMPDDDLYAASQSFAEALQDADEDEDDTVHEWADSYVDCYTGQLTHWLARHCSHVEYITEALQEFGPFDDGFKLLQTAQYLFWRSAAGSMLEALREEFEEQEANAVDEDEDESANDSEGEE